MKGLKILDENITDITTIVGNGVPLLYITNKQNKKMSMNHGDGIRKIMNIALIMLANLSSVLLLDKVENGPHYSLHDKFRELIATLTTQESRSIQNKHIRTSKVKITTERNRQSFPLFRVHFLV